MIHFLWDQFFAPETFWESVVFILSILFAIIYGVYSKQREYDKEEAKKSGMTTDEYIKSKKNGAK